VLDEKRTVFSRADRILLFLGKSKENFFKLFFSYLKKKLFVLEPSRILSNKGESLLFFRELNPVPEFGGSVPEKFGDRELRFGPLNFL
jgi:hypothetical protein